METKALKPTFSRKLQSRTDGAEGTALADEADVAGPRHAFGKGGVEAGQWTHDAQAVGADNAHLRTAGAPQNFRFELRAGFADLFETGGDDDRTLDARPPHIPR